MEFIGIDRLRFNGKKENKETYLWHVIFSWLYFLAKAINEGSMIPPLQLQHQMQGRLCRNPNQESESAGTKQNSTAILRSANKRKDKIQLYSSFLHLIP
jgi:hypothetical protein